MTYATSGFVYVICIRTTPDELWSALTTPAVVRQYSPGERPGTDWKVGSP